MGADNTEAAEYACRTEGITNVMFNTLEAACARLCSDPKLFIGWTHQAQNLEGQILKAYATGYQKRIVCLPVQNALALPVPPKHRLPSANGLKTLRMKYLLKSNKHILYSRYASKLLLGRAVVLPNKRTIHH